MTDLSIQRETNQLFREAERRVDFAVGTPLSESKNLRTDRRGPMRLQTLNVAARSEVMDEVYEPPALVEVGDFTELTLGFILNPVNDGRPPPFNTTLRP